MQRHDSEMGELYQRLGAFAEGLRAIGKGLEPLAERLRACEEAFKPVIKAIEPIALGVREEFSKYAYSDEILAKAGWLPHYTTPFNHISKFGGDVEAIKMALLEYYTKNWKNVRYEIETRLSNYKIDPEAKATFRESLDAHEAGLYRCVSRVLFPELERLFRVEVLDKNIGKITSSAMIKGLVNRESALAHNASLGDFMPNGFFELIIFDRMTRILETRSQFGSTIPSYGLYDSVFTPESLEQVKQDPVPNRHAALHGLVAYSSPLNSLNMIFVADYLFQVVNYLKVRSFQDGYQ